MVKYVNGRLTLELDKDDPETPVMVYVVARDIYSSHRDKILASATYHCARGECEVDGYALAPEEIEWLDLHDNECCEFYDKYRVAE